MTTARAIAAASGSLLTTLATHAQTDRIIDTETGWSYLYGASSTTINTQLSAGQRPFSIERTALNQYDTVFVSNSGPYAVTGTQMLYGASTASLSSWLSTNNLRLLELEPYDSSGSLFVTAVGVPNSGATATPGWGYLVNVTFNQIVSWINSNPTLRLIDLDAYTLNGNLQYSAVAVPNSGANFQSGWWYGGNMTPAQITASLTANSARLISIELEDAGTISTPATFACVMVAQNPGGGWWHPSLDSSQVAALLDANSGRLSCLKRYTNFVGQTRWAVALIDNANPQSRRMRQYMWDADCGGSTGFMLKQVGGPVLASNNVNFVYEPCSTVKLLHGIYAIYRCSQNNGEALSDNVLYKNLCAPCPFTWTCADQFLTLSTTLSNMLQPSNNYALIALEKRYGVPTLNAWADARGFGDIQIDRQTCDCALVLNTATCTDLCDMIEQASDGSLFNSNWENTLHQHMNNLDNLGYNSYSTLSAVIDEEAASTDLTPSEISAFRAAVEYANKGGSYACSSTFWRTEGAWARIPFKVLFAGSYVTFPREYAIATFAHNATDDNAAKVVHRAKEEILREQIREALESWDVACHTPGVSNQPDPITRAPGQTATFQVVAAPNTEGPTYQWLKGGAAMVNGATGTGSTVSGATTSTLTITSVSAADANSYRCRLTTSCGQTLSNSASLTISSACFANCDGSTVQPVLTANDFQCFINKYAASSSAANCDGSTVQPILTANDFQCFIDKYAAGCS